MSPIVIIPGDFPPMIAGSPHLDRLRDVAEVRLFDTRPASDDEKLRRVAGATVILNSRGSVQWPGPLLRQLPQLKLIACCAVGFDCIDLPVARELGITVTNVPGRTAKMVAEHALALLDVFEREPLPANEPLLECANIVLTSHAADQLDEAFEALSAGAVDNVLAWFAGRPQNVVS